MSRSSRTRRWLRLIAGNVLILVLLLALAKGDASYLLFTRDLTKARVKYESVVGHYNEKGNEVVARVIQEGLTKHLRRTH